jgi:nucleotide-binding universal stress UspA family protein
MKTILIPTDFSDNSFKAACYAIDLFGSEGNEFILLNAYKVPYQSAGTLVSLDGIMKKESEEDLELFRKRVNEKYEDLTLNLTNKSEYNLLADEIARFQNERKIDYVVMGTQGENQINKRFLGSNTTKVLSKVLAPTIVVPNNFQGDKIKNILFAADLKAIEDKDILRPLTGIAKLNKATVKILNVLTEKEVVVTEAEALNGLALNHLFEGVSHNFFETKGENIAESIDSFAKDENVELISILKRKYGFWENIFHTSVTKDLALHTSIPMLVIPE